MRAGHARGIEMEQTNRTILFEELNSRKENIISIIRQQEQRESLTDDEVAEVRQCLEVTSFKELMEKFQPEIYMRLDTDRFEVRFSRTLPQKAEGYVALPLCREEGFFEELVRLMDDKKQKKYVLSSFQDFSDNILPSDTAEKFLEKRDELVTNVNKGLYHNAEKILDWLISEYDDGIFLIKTFLRQVSSYIAKIETCDNSACFILGTQGDCQVHPVQISQRFLTWSSCTRKERNNYLNFLREHIEVEELSNRNLMLIMLSMACTPGEENRPLIQEYYSQYLGFYTRMLREFWWAAKPLMEVLLGIRSYFDQYTPALNSTDKKAENTETQAMPPRLLITNCRPEFLNNDRYKETLRLYLETVNEKNDFEDTIWFAILPNIEYAGKKQANIRERFQSSHKNREYGKNLQADVMVLMEILSAYRIQIFVSAQPVPESTFKGFVREGMEPWRDTFDFLRQMGSREYAVPCYPNFTVMPQEYAMLILGNETTFSALDKRIIVGKDVKLWLDDLNVEASYVAAGLIAACQCPAFLKAHYPRNVKPDMPGVAYQLCDKGQNRITVTQMFHEIIDYPQELYDRVYKESNGMVFAPMLGRVIALTDRAYSYRPSSLDHIAARQTITYMERIMRHYTQDFKENLIRDFFQERPGSIIAWWKEAGNCVNGILKTGESIKYEIRDRNHTCKFEVAFERESREEVVRII